MSRYDRSRREPLGFILYIYVTYISIYYFVVGFILFIRLYFFVFTYQIYQIPWDIIYISTGGRSRTARRPPPGALGSLLETEGSVHGGGPSVGFKPWGKMVVDIWGNLLKWWVSPTGRKILLKMISTWGVTWGYLPPFKETHPVNIASGMQTLYNTLDTNYTDICIYESILAAAWCICMIWKKQMILWILLYVICRGFYLLGYMWDCFWTAVDAFLVSRWYCWWRRSCTTWHILETCKQTVNLDYTY